MAKHIYDNDFVIKNIGDLKNNYDQLSYRGGSPSDATTTAVAVTAFAYTPATIDVRVGDTVTWTFSSVHTVTSGVYATDGVPGDGLFDSGFIGGGGLTYSFVVDEVRDYNYFCQIHPTTMAGLIRVSPRKSADLTGYVPISKIVPGPFSLRGRTSAYTPTRKGGNPLEQGN